MFAGLYHPFMVFGGMVYYCYTNIICFFCDAYCYAATHQTMPNDPATFRFVQASAALERKSLDLP